MKINLFKTTLAILALFIFAPQAQALAPTSTATTTEVQEKSFSEKFSN